MSEVASAPLVEPAARIPTLLGIAALAGGYYGAAKIGYVLEVTGPVSSMVWLPVGVGMAFLYLGGLRFWPGILLGDLLANDYSALPVGSALAQTCGNVLEIVVAVVVLRRLVRGGSPVETVRGVGCMLVAIGLGTLASATIGSVSVLLGGVVSAAEWATVWRTWWLGDAVGGLIVLPIAIAWHRLPPRAWWRACGLEVAAMLVSIAMLTFIALHTNSSLTYIVFPALIWAALRLGPRGATLAVVVAALLAVWLTAHENGPFHYRSITHTVLSTQLYIGIGAISTLLLAAATSERETLANQLRRSRGRLVEAADAERQRIERDIHDGAQQRLTALAYKLRHAIDQAGPEVALLEDAEGEVLLAIDEVRQLAHGIRPTVLTDLGLANAIRSIAARSIIPITLNELPTSRFDDTAEVTAYYVVAEAIANAHKHADPATIRVRAWSSVRTLSVEVSDDGRGGADESRGGGLQGLRDRVEAVGGVFDVSSPAGVGTRVAAVIPAVARV